MSKKVAVIMTDLVEDIEYTSPKEAMEAEGHEVVVISPDGSTVEGKKGGKFEADFSIGDVSADDYDALLIPGGFSPDGLRGDSEDRFAKFSRHFLEADKPVFAICHGPQLLVDTDLLKDRHVTSVKNVKNDLINAGANWDDKALEVCGNLVTSRTPKDLDEFNGEIKRQLA
ncbi:MAG TPA: type 1 glutamine amidotransferase [Candidatus Jeotgalicoccus stercoravium]|jgi:protease I|nr:type 1 glutamine amidotransferase [Candidatus Jeotgalicoccus stercoravium]